MKKGIFSALLFLITTTVSAQTDGLSYQAVIIGPDNQELPGRDAEGNILPNSAISIRFSIIDANNVLRYQEVQTTNTDQYGRVNLLIGKANPSAYTQIDWDATPKDLKVEIDFSATGNNYVDLGREALTFVPYSYHRNITAKGSLKVDGPADLNSELTVQGPVNLNSSLSVNNNNPTNLSGDLTVEGHSDFKDGITAGGVTKLDTLDIAGDMKVAGNSNFAGDAVFDGEVDFTSPEPATFNSISIDSTATFRGDLIIATKKSDTLALQNRFEDYPLQVSGSEQGIAIRVNGQRQTSKNFISFWDESGKAPQGTMWGRIEGISNAELESSEAYIQGRRSKNWDIFMASYDEAKATSEGFVAIAELVAAYSSSTPCIGVGACVTAPIPSLIVAAVINQVATISDFVVTSVNLVKAIKERADFHDNSIANIGVTYSSGAGDYAEWLPKQNPSEIFIEGEIIGVKNGLATKNTWNAEKIMIVSTRPIVLGNMPQQANEKNSVKIAFMGQVPARVVGSVTPGDYILPDELSIGFGKAVHPKDMKINDYRKIVGVAWEIKKEIAKGVSIVNVAVGINSNDLTNVISAQSEELTALRQEHEELKDQIRQSNEALVQLVPGYAKAAGIGNENRLTLSEKVILPGFQKQAKKLEQQEKEDVIYFQISREEVSTGITIAREQYIQAFSESRGKIMPKGGIFEMPKNKIDEATLPPIDEHPFWKKIDSDSTYREAIIDFILQKTEKAYHTHKKYLKNFSNLKIRY